MGIYQGMELRMLRSTSIVEEHWHPDIDVFFVVEGWARAVVQGKVCDMAEEDILLVNSSLTHSVAIPENAIVCGVKYPWRMVSELLGSAAFVFHCNSAQDRSHPYHDLRNIFRSLVCYCAQERRRTSCLLDSQMLRLLDCLTEHYLVELDRSADAHLSDEARLQRIFQFVNQNYRESTGLSQLAAELYVSPSALSRFFKKQTGMGFMDYLNQVRVHAAARELERTEGNVTRVAVNSGFSNLSVFKAPPHRTAARQAMPFPPAAPANLLTYAR